MNSRLRRISAVIASFVLAVLSIGGGVPASALNPNKIEVYIAPPLVQGTFVSGGVTEDFNSYSTGACPSSLAIGTVTGNCTITAANSYGGATAGGADATPTVGGSGSKYATTGGGSPEMTFQLSSASHYIGFWWSAGSPTNYVTFYSGDQQLTRLSTQQLMTMLGTAPSAGTWGSLNTAGNSLTAVDGSQNKKVWYFGNPRGYSSNPPTSGSTYSVGEPFVYVHLFAHGDISFDKVKFSGAGFEFDNLVIAEAAQSLPDPNNLTIIQTLYPDETVTFDPNEGQGTMSDQVESEPTNLTTNTFTREGYHFVGWNTDAGGAGDSYADGAEFPFDESLTLFAQWEADATVSFDPNDGVGSMSDQTSQSATNLTLNTFTREGYHFVGWNTDAGGAGDSYADGAEFPFDESLTLFAQWEADAGSGGSGGGSSSGSLARTGVPEDVGLAATLAVSLLAGGLLLRYRRRS